MILLVAAVVVVYLDWGLNSEKKRRSRRMRRRERKIESPMRISPSWSISVGSWLV